MKFHEISTVEISVTDFRVASYMLAHRDVTLPPAMWSTVGTGHDIAEAYNYLITYFLTATYLLYFQCCGGGAKNLPHDSWAP